MKNKDDIFHFATEEERDEIINSVDKLSSLFFGDMPEWTDVVKKLHNLVVTIEERGGLMNKRIGLLLCTIALPIVGGVACGVCNGSDLDPTSCDTTSGNVDIDTRGSNVADDAQLESE